MSYFVGVDVGTKSARAALVNQQGRVEFLTTRDIKIWNDGDFYEQSSDNIWAACVACVKDVTSYVPKESVKGIGFDATCSLVAINKNGDPLSVSKTGNDEQNIVMWLDHRAFKEADFITNLKHDVLKYVGGKISLEMQTPKLLWLKTHLKEECWDKVGYFFDLPDFLTWKATGCDSRSLCSLVCKWTYEISPEGSQKGWNKSYFKKLSIDDLLVNKAKIIGSKVQQPGTPVGKGLSLKAAKELNLMEGTPVGTSLIDAHAGGLGVIGCLVEGIDPDFKSRISLICGTSTCHMAVSTNPIFTKGIWGPYFSAMVPDMWLNEGGQSVTGKLIDFIIESHPITPQIIKHLPNNSRIESYLNNLLKELAQKRNLSQIDYLTSDIHIYPDFHGNRSPVADATLKGSICGLTIESSEENLAILYLATIQALAYGTRHIIETLCNSGYESIKTILICGGLSKNEVFLKTQANATNLSVVCPCEVESVLIGAAILGACAAGVFSHMNDAILSMGGKGELIKPDHSLKIYHDKKYKVFLRMLQDQIDYKNIMKS